MRREGAGNIIWEKMEKTGRNIEIEKEHGILKGING